MDSLRRRVPFTIKDEDEEESDHVLDEQEQEELIQSLRTANAASDRKALILLYAILGMSFFAQLVRFTPLTLMPLIVHLNLLLILRHHPQAFSFQLTYATAFVAPTLALFLGYSVAWWCLTPNLAALEGMRYRALGA
ncbi:hypothetical protein CPB85DRAFT_185760 [Mucidula mucida]|nr:hypothetical protein CPB85DRAFT_185760 [Mucidula mucida]